MQPCRQITGTFFSDQINGVLTQNIVRLSFMRRWRSAKEHRREY